MSLTTCIRRAGDALRAEDKAEILAAAAKYRAEGMSPTEAAQRAVDEQIAAVQAMIDNPELRPSRIEPEASSADTGTKESRDAARNLDDPSAGALEGAPPDGVQAPAAGGGTGQRTADGGRGDGAGTAEPDGAGVQLPGGLGAGPGDVPVPAGRKGRKPRGAGQRGVQGGGGVQPGLGFLENAGGTGGLIPVNPAPNAAPIPAPEFKAEDFVIDDDLALGEGGPKAKFQGNVAAIRLVRQLEAESRMATPSEQRVLARYVGWGGLAQAFDADKSDWTREYAELKALLSDEEWDAAARSTRYAHYTSREIIQDGIYAALRRMGFRGGRTLEGGAGVGNFIGLMPVDMRSASRFTAIEREPFSAAIARHLYPRQNVQEADFTAFVGNDDFYDAAVGNPPFASDPQTDTSGRKHLSGLSLHNYFFAKEVDMLREGGILAQVITNGFLDAKTDVARRYISDRTKLLGAIRLPNNAFSKNANTEVTTDLIFLQKLPESEWGGKAARLDAKRWLDTGTFTDPEGREVPLNQYFLDNPNMMLGQFGAYGTMYRGESPALVQKPGQDTARMLRQAVERLPADVYTDRAVSITEAMEREVVRALTNPTVQEGGYFISDGKLQQRIKDIAGEARAREITPETKWTEKTALGDSGFAKLTALAELRTTLRALLAAELASDAAMDGLRKTLNTQYDAYVKAHGLINDKPTLRVFDDDPDYPLLSSLEHGFTPGIGVAAAKTMGIKPTAAKADKAPIFTRRVIDERKPVQRVESPADALAVSMAERGKLDSAYIGELLGRNPQDVLEELAEGDKPLLFRDPATNEYVLRDAYLSGNVRAKLVQAKQAGLFGNIRALEDVQPADVGAHEIVARIGSPWVPESVYVDFAKTLFGEGTKAVIQYVKLSAGYSAAIYPGNSVAASNTWGTASYPGDDILVALLNNRPIRVTYKDADGNMQTDKDATDAANIKAQEMRDKFQDWLFRDADRSEILVRAYNDTNNNYVTRQFDGAWMTFPGKVPDAIVKFRRHQRNAIARIVQDRTALLDHVVGAGKTYTVIAGAMELKRTGLAKKPLIVVPNHLVKQWATDFYRLYPGANILTATKKDFAKENRRKFLAKIATGDWDAVIMAHSSFGFVKPAPEFESRFNTAQIKNIVDTIKQVEDGDGDKQQKKRTVKQLEGLKERLENRIKSLRDKPMDSLLDFDEIGIDQLFVDEAHLFKNLMFSTKMQNIAGLGDSKGSQRAYDMYVKVNEVFQKNGRGQGVVFATGTPVSNSLAEMYHMMRYLMPDAIEASGFQSFDAWANTYASVEQVWMQKASGDGFKPQNRMSNFVNTPELLKVFDQVSDTVTMDDIKAAFREENDGKEFPLPKLKGGKRTPVSLRKSAGQNAYMATIAERARILEARKGPPQKGDDNILVIMTDARKAAMDIRLVDPAVTVREPGGRIDRASQEIAARYKQYDKVKGTQLVFSDLGTPLKSVKKEMAEFQALQDRIAAGASEDVRVSANLGNEAALAKIEDAEDAQAELEAKGRDWAGAMQAAMRGFSVYDDLKAALIEQGIPEAEIAFIHDFNTDEQKAGLFRKVNAGQIRVLMGSTPKLGAGTNVQERLVALHHLDVPWKPSDVEQREGRIIRQGNLLDAQMPGFEVEVLAYVTQDSLDMRMWQVQETKLRMINQLRTRKIGREIDNAFEDLELSAGEMQAAATGNMDLLRELQLRSEIKKLEQRRRAYDAQRNDLENRKKSVAATLAALPAKVEKSRVMAEGTKEYRAQLEARKFSVTIDGQEYTDARQAGQVLQVMVDAKRFKFADGKGGFGEKFYTQADLDAGLPAQDGVDPAAMRKDQAVPLSVEMNGEVYTSRTKLADAFAEIRGDAAPIAWTFKGTEYTRRTALAEALRQEAADALIEQAPREIGSIGPFAVTIEGMESKWGASLEVLLEYGGKDMAVSVSAQDDATKLATSVITAASNMATGAQSQYDYEQDMLKRTLKAKEDLDATPMPGEWPDAGKLEQARAAHQKVLRSLATAGVPVAAPEPGSVIETLDGDMRASGPDENEADVLFSRQGGTGGVAMRDARAVAGMIRAALPKAPPIVLHESVDKAPKSLRDVIYAEGAENDVEAAYHEGEIHVFPSNLESIERMEFVVGRHEVRHHGVRAMLGPRYGQVLLGMSQQNPGLRAAARQKMDDGLARSMVDAVDEALADMPVEELAQLTGFDRLVSLIRQWLRNTAASLRRAGMRALANAIEPKTWTDKDVAAFVWRAEDMSRRGGGAATTTGGTMFGREAINGASWKAGGFTITPAMREKAGGGVPMFSRTAAAPDIDRAWRDLSGNNKFSDYDQAPATTVTGDRGDFVLHRASGSQWAALNVRDLTRDNGDTVYSASLEVGMDGYPKGTGAATTMYLEALNIAKQRGIGWQSEGVRSDKALAIYDRLQKAGVPFKQDGASSVIDAKALAAVDLNAVAKTLGDKVAPVSPSSTMFSRRAPSMAVTRAAARNSLADMLGDAGAKVSWWQKTLGTQYAKARKHPAYGAVFDKVQEYLEDTSTLANEAADAAPAILPKLESWGDFKRMGISQKDADAIAAPIFKGTLDKVRYSAAQLRSEFGLTEAQVAAYGEFFKSVNLSLDQIMAADVVRMIGDLNPALRTLALEDRGALRTGVLAFLEEQIEANPDDAALAAMSKDITEKYARIDQLKSEGYAPLMRFGKYAVNFTDPATNETLFFGLYESASEANKAARELKQDPELAQATMRQGVLSQKQYEMFAAVPLDSLEMFAEALGTEKSEVFQEYIRLAKNNRSALKRLLKRKGTAGYSTDARRVLAAFVTSNARLASGALNLTAAKEAARNIRDGDVQDEAIGLVENVQNPGETASWARAMLFTNFIGGSIASAIVNVTQPITMTLPWLSQFGGMTKAGARLMAAGKMAASGKIGDKSLAAALKRAEDDGIVSPQEIHYLQAQAMGKWGANPILQRVAFAWAAPFTMAEQFNRRVTFIAAYQTAKQEGMTESAFEFAQRAVTETQGLYNKGNQANWARNPVGATVLTFKQFSVHYLEWMGRMWSAGAPGSPERKAGRVAVLYALAILVVAAGTDGLPFADDLDDLVDTLGQAFGYDVNSKRARRNFVANTLGMGDAAADIFARGFSAAAGIPFDVSLRMSMGNLLPGTGVLLRSNTDRSRDVLEIAGAAGGLAAQYMDAGEKLLKGDVAGAAITATPVAIQNVSKAVGMWSTGEARDKLDRKVMDTDAVDGLMRFLGFNPQGIARESEKMGMLRRSEQLAKNVEAEIAGQWARAFADKDQDGIAQAKRRLADWNKSNPDARISITGVQILQRVKKLRQDRSQRFITATSAERRLAVAESLQ